MAERKAQLDKVAFGGAWAEGLLSEEVFREVLSTLREAVEKSGDQDPAGPGLDQALAFVTTHVEKGPLLVSAFRRGLSLERPEARREVLNDTYTQIVRWSGF